MTKKAIFLFGLAVGITAVLTLNTFLPPFAQAQAQQATEKVEEAHPYSELLKASNTDEIRTALEKLEKKTISLEPLPQATTRKLFGLLVDGKGDFGNEWDCHLIGHLGAVSGDVELLRKMVYTYFGAAEGEVKGSNV